MTLGDHILKFCRTISEHAPVYVKAEPLSAARVSMCFHNVKAVCDERGGAPLYGWLIWEWEKTLLEAEHHAVWQHGETLSDVTPQLSRRAELLFLPDPGRQFDFDTHRRLDNRRMPLRRSADVVEYIALSGKFVAIEDAHTSDGEVYLPPPVAAQMHEISMRLRELEAKLAAWSVSRLGKNDRCWCGSNVKHKFCCMEHSRHSLLQPMPGAGGKPFN